jgi:RsiW-degrading membrane proteinase PrsW (M82 family)
MGTEPPQQQCVIPLHKPSWKELAFFFISGVLVSVPMALFFSQAYPFVPVIISVAVFAPFVEEFAKVFPLFYRHGETERSYVTLGALIGLGFGVSEFFLYVVVLNVPPIVRIPGIIFHASSAAVTAYGIAKKKPLLYYLMSVALHATNNFFAVVNVGLGVFVELIVLIIVYLLAWRFYHQASSEKMVV